MHVITDIELFLKRSPSVLKIDIQKVVKGNEKSRNTDLTQLTYGGKCEKNYPNIYRINGITNLPPPPPPTHTHNPPFTDQRGIVFLLKK